MNKKLELLKKLQRAHDVYVSCNNEQKCRLFDACAPLISQLCLFNYSPVVLESLLMFGSDFYWKEHLIAAGDDELKESFGI